MNIRSKTFAVLVPLTVAVFLSGCTTTFGKKSRMQKELGLQQIALNNSLKLCTNFGHKEGTQQYTRCVEQRYDEFILTNK